MTKILAVSAAVAMTMLSICGSAFAQTLVDPFGPNAVSMSADDLALMRQSIEKVLAAKKAGAVSEWRSAKGENTGRSSLRKTFTRDGLPCGEVEHVFTSGDGHRYVLPFCEVKGGQWKLAF